MDVQGFRVTVRFSGARKMLDKPSGVHPAGAVRNLTISNGFPMSPMHIQGAAVEDSFDIEFSQEGRMVETYRFRNVSEGFPLTVRYLFILLTGPSPRNAET